MFGEMTTPDSTPAIAPAVPDEINELTISKMSYPLIYRLHIEGNIIATHYLLKSGKIIITLLENLIHPDAGYCPIGTDFNFTNLDLITKQMWNMIICVSSSTDSDMNRQLLYHVCAFISMECDIPDSYYNMCSDIWEFIILQYLDSEYDSNLGCLGGYKKWKYILRAIEEYPAKHGLDTLAKQKYALSILIMTYLDHKDPIMHMYDNEYERIDTNKKYYRELKALITSVSKNAHLDAEMISSQFIKDIFYFMND